MPLSVIAFVIFVVAALFKLTGTHGDVLQWLIIIAGLVLSAAVAWGWGYPLWTARSRPVQRP